MKRYVLDACALLAFLKKEEGSEIVKNIINSNDDVFLHGVNLLEVYYDLLREFGKDKADSICKEILEMPIKAIYNTSLFFIKTAGYFKANYRISLGDSFVLATAEVHSAIVVTSDGHELSVVESKEPGLNFLWIR
ncbi:MAG: type II toxin-antitoxin system VapC family toxin [Fibromonadales bacterium]|nr:type II toxin-antitoxin system VapC family toxin [Fibromonadales bacterium]